jgi:oxaloacetate decarboxylase (Na+ extruding) subunit gamma
MTITQMLQQSGLLTVLGMGIVFLFIIIMIIVMRVLHTVIHAFHLDNDVYDEQKKTVQIKNTDDEVAAAIAAALHNRGEL